MAVKRKPFLFLYCDTRKQEKNETNTDNFIFRETGKFRPRTFTKSQTVKHNCFNEIWTRSRGDFETGWVI